MAGHQSADGEEHEPQRVAPVRPDGPKLRAVPYERAAEQHHAGCAMSGAYRAADRTDGACGFDAGDGLRHPLREGCGKRRAGAALVCAHRKAAHANACKTVFDLRAAEQTERGDDEQRTCADRDRER